MAFQVDRNADSATPNKRAATMRGGTSTVSAIIIIGTATIVLPIRRIFFRPLLSERMPSGIDKNSIAPSSPKRSPTTPGLTPISGKKAVRYTRRYPMPMLLKSPANMSHVTLRGIVEKNPTVAFPSSSQRIPQETLWIPRLINQSSSYKRRLHPFETLLGVQPRSGLFRYHLLPE